jgi:hypothetical protein
MYTVNTPVIVTDKNDLEHYNQIGRIVEIDEQATEGDCYGVRFGEGGTTFYFRATEIGPFDEEKERQAWEADMRDMEKIKNEWRQYRLEGDETPSDASESIEVVPSKRESARPYHFALVGSDAQLPSRHE